MKTVGRFGITRDKDGSLSELTEWPWYWRYAFGLALAGLSVAAYFWIAGDHRYPWLPFVIAGAGLLWALLIMRELGCLAVVIVGFGAIWLVLDTVLPDSNLPFDWRIVALAIATYYAWYVGNKAQMQAAENKRLINALWERIKELEGDTSDLYPTGVQGLHRRLSELEERLEDNDSSNLHGSP